MTIQYRIELIFVPVRDADRAKAFYTEQLGWHADFDQVVQPGLRFVQVTPPGSACSTAFGEGIAEDEPGTMRNVQAVIDDADATRAAQRSGPQPLDAAGAARALSRAA